MPGTNIPSTGLRLIAAAVILLSLAAVPAWADWRKELGTFRIGMIEAQGRQYSPADLAKIRAAYSTALGMPVEIFQAKDFPSLIDAHASSRIEYAVYTAEAYATAYLACECIEPLAAPVADNGSAGVRTALVIDARLSLANLAGSKGIAFPGTDSMTTYGVALASFQTNGSRLAGTEKWLADAGQLDRVIEKFNEAEVDGFFISVPSQMSLAAVLGADTALAGAIGPSGRKAKAAWLSDIVPFGPHAVRKNLAPEAKTIVLKMLETLATSDQDINDLLLPEGAGQFAPVSHNSYGLALNATKALAAASGLPKP